MRSFSRHFPRLLLSSRFGYFTRHVLQLELERGQTPWRMPSCNETCSYEVLRVHLSPACVAFPRVAHFGEVVACGSLSQNCAFHRSVIHGEARYAGLPQNCDT